MKVLLKGSNVGNSSLFCLIVYMVVIIALIMMTESYHLQWN
jgi:hypothetical protein